MFKGVSRKFIGCFNKGISRKFQECSKEVSMIFQGYFKKALRDFHGILKGYSGSFDDVSRVFQRSSKGVSRNQLA